MTGRMEELARRALACPAWRWMPGMQTADREVRIFAAASDGRPCGWTRSTPHAFWVQDATPGRWHFGEQLLHCSYAHPWTGPGKEGVGRGGTNGPWWNPRHIPDFSDRATLGCLEGLVADAWGSSLMYVEPCGGVFEARRFEVRNLLGRVADGYPIDAFVNISGPSRVEALVIALERAPRR